MDMSTNETTTEAPVSIIGFGAAGFNTAIALRTSGYTGPIRVFSDIDTLPYSPILTSYYAAGELDYEECFPWSQAEIDEATKTLREARLSARTKADVSALEALIAQVNALDLRAYTLDSVVPVNRLMTLLTQAVNDPEITQAEADDLAAQMQAAIDQLQPVSEESTSAEGGAQTSDDASAADTSSTAQSGMFAAVLGAAAGMLTLMKRRKGQKR